jgi:uncharacterized ParB-like nuclease family protein
MAAPSTRSAPASSPAPVALAVADLQVDAAIQPRATLTASVIDEYATLYAEADDHEPLPPLDVFQVEGVYYLADGFHRAAAATHAQRPTVLCRVYQGTRQDAIRHAALANLKRGLPYAFDDRTRVLERLLQDPEMGQRSDRQLAADLGLSHMTVYRARSRLAHIATLTQEVAAQPITATAPAAQQREQLAAFLAVPVEQVALAAKRGLAESAEVVRDIARSMADHGQPAEEAKRQKAEQLVYWAERQAREDAGQYGAPRRRETAEARRKRQADNELQRRVFALHGILRTLTELLPSTPEDEAEGYEPYTPHESPADLIAAAERDIARRQNSEETRAWERAHIVQQLQTAYRALDAFKPTFKGTK